MPYSRAFLFLIHLEVCFSFLEEEETMNVILKIKNRNTSLIQCPKYFKLSCEEAGFGERFTLFIFGF